MKTPNQLPAAPCPPGHRGFQPLPVPSRSHFLASGFPLLLFLVIPLLSQPLLPAWVFMWILALAIFAACKGLTWRLRTAPARPRAALNYLFLWVGMDADAFLRPRSVAQPTPRDWISALIRLGSGLALLGTAVSLAQNGSPLSLNLVAWIGLVGVVLVLHFGAFQGLALLWRQLGHDAQPLMNAPLRATSLSDFWGRRWNTAFHSLANRWVYSRLSRLLGPALSLMVTFLISGLVHDVVLSLPARGGYGQPTLYFLIQGAGILFENSPVGRTLGLKQRGFRARFFTLAVLAVPLPFLFHQPFLTQVVIPMLRSIGATL